MREGARVLIYGGLTLATFLLYVGIALAPLGISLWVMYLIDYGAFLHILYFILFSVICAILTCVAKCINTPLQELMIHLRRQCDRRPAPCEPPPPNLPPLNNIIA